uniref:Phospholipid phosphatase 2 n=1 Tax=Naja naja TaxID=35670 RepID=A0A8C6V4N6_NAJNA
MLCLFFSSLAASLPFAILTLVNSPYKRGFYCEDTSIRYPYKPDTITHGVMAGVTIPCTVFIISVGEAYLVYTERLYSRSQFNNYLAALYKVIGTFLFGSAVSQSLTDLAKYTIGRLRPNFLAVCDPDWTKVNCSVYVQVEDDIPVIYIFLFFWFPSLSRLSFYSGHSSFGMYCMMFLAVSESQSSNGFCGRKGGQSRMDAIFVTRRRNFRGGIPPVRTGSIEPVVMILHSSENWQIVPWLALPLSTCPSPLRPVSPYCTCVTSHTCPTSLTAFSPAQSLLKAMVANHFGLLCQKLCVR